MTDTQTEEPAETFSFADDAPRRDPWTEDDFGYRPFAKRMADVLWDLPAPNGYVLGLHGVWGAGKTTALNFISHFINARSRAEPDSAIQIVRFSPWMFSGHQDLISAFFRVLAETLKDGGETIRKARKVVRTTAKVVVDPAVRAAVTVAAAAHPTDAAAIRASGALAKTAMDQTIEAWLGEPTLQAAHEDLVKRLGKTGRRFIVFIDDMDRLEPAEIRAVMQMVKSVGQLPKVVYVLAYDRRIIWRALGESDQRKGGEPTFTEKIIQHELELPHAGRSALLRRIDSELKFVFDHVEGGSRWRKIVQHGFHRWIRSPRDIVRFANALRFTWPPLTGEVDAADVVAMEGLRLFDPAAFDWVRANRDFLVDGPGYMPDAARKAYGTAFREGLDSAQRDDIIELLSALFPSRSKYLRLDERFSGGEIWAQTVARRGIASQKGFEAYFTLFPSDYAIPKALIDEAAAAPDDEGVQMAALARAIATVDDRGQSLVGEYIDELQYRQVAGSGMVPGKAMLKALVRNAAFIQTLEERNGMIFAPVTSLHYLLRKILTGWDPAMAGEALIEAVEGVPAEVLATLWVWRAREVGVLPADGAEVGEVISQAAFKALGRRTLAAIKAEQHTSLMDAPFYWDILRSWAKLGSVSEAKAWVSKTASSDAHRLAKVSKGILAYSVDSNRRWYSFRGLGEDRPFYDAKVLLTACEAFVGLPNLNQDERDRIVALRDGLISAREQAKAKADNAMPENRSRRVRPKPIKA